MSVIYNKFLHWSLIILSIKHLTISQGLKKTWIYPNMFFEFKYLPTSDSSQDFDYCFLKM